MSESLSWIDHNMYERNLQKPNTWVQCVKNFRSIKTVYFLYHTFLLKNGQNWLKKQTHYTQFLCFCKFYHLFFGLKQVEFEKSYNTALWTFEDFPRLMTSSHIRASTLRFRNMNKQSASILTTSTTEVLLLVLLWLVRASDFACSPF